MEIYVMLLLLVISLSIFISSLKIDRYMKREYFLKIIFLVIFLIYSLRSSSVGRDLFGYKQMYLITSVKEWSDYSYIYFEKGYIFLMKICNFIGLSFQGFLMIVNFLILIPIYIFIRKYSKYPFLSVIMYICYMFFEFNLTGIRQAIASSIVLFGIIVLIESKKYRLLKYIVIIYLSTLFHKGAFVGFLYIPFHFINDLKKYTSIILTMFVVFILGRKYMINFIKIYFNKGTMNANADLYIGLNFLFIIGLAILIIVAEKNRKIMWKKIIKGNINKEEILRKNFYIKEKEDLINSTFNKIFLLSIGILILLGSDTSVRSSMILNQVVLVQFPNCIDNLFKQNSKKIAIVGITIFFILFFLFNTLISNNFDIVPYKFFWQNNI